MPESITISQIQLNDIISFTTYGVGGILQITNGTVIGIETGTNLRNPTAAAAEHTNLFGAIPQSTSNPIPNDYRKYNYLLIQKTDNTLVEVGFPWINQSTLTRLAYGTLTVVIEDFTTSNLPILTAFLLAQGWTNNTITYSN